MKTRVINLGISLALCLSISACNNEEFFEKEFLETPTDVPKTDGSANGGQQGGFDGGTGGTQGGVDSGVDGGSTGGATTGSTTGGVEGGTTGGGDGSTTGGSTTGGSTTGGSAGNCNNAYGNDDEVGPESNCKMDKFFQASEQSKKLDVVWIIDNSGSMADEQEALGVNFDAFINDFITKGADFKMAITTTDVSSSTKKGQMVVGSDTKLTSQAAQTNEAQFKSDFKTLVKVGTKGSGYEKGLEASEGFMQKYASTFLRPDAYLAVVIISDEEDQSPQTVKAYTDFLKEFKDSEGLVKVYSIVDVNNTNCCSWGIATGSARYQSASNNTGGKIGNITDDFHHVLSDMGDSIINLLDSFALSSEPQDGSLKVYVNGTETSNYTYDSSSWSIKFNQNDLPSVGAEVRVYYVKK